MAERAIPTDVQHSPMGLAVAVSMFYDPGEWTDERRRMWKALTGSDEATTKVLGDYARGVLAHNGLLLMAESVGADPGRTVTATQLAICIEHLTANGTLDVRMELTPEDHDAIAAVREGGWRIEGVGRHECEGEAQRGPADTTMLVAGLRRIAQWQREKCEHADAETLFMLLDNKVGIATAVLAAFEAEQRRLREPEDDLAEHVTQAALRHKRRGTLYVELGRGPLQASTPCAEGEVIVSYVGEDGRVWHRPAAEFDDGRYEPAPVTEALRQFTPASGVIRQRLSMIVDAHRWRALLSSPNVRLVGWAGMQFDKDQRAPMAFAWPHDDYVHFGVEFTSKTPMLGDRGEAHVSRLREQAIAFLATYADGLRAMAARPAPTDPGRPVPPHGSGP